MEKTREQQIAEFRKAFSQLSETDKKAEAARLVRLTQHIPIIIFEDYDRNKVLKFADMPNLVEYFWKEKQIRADRSFLYKVLKGKYSNAYGYKIRYYYEEEL